MNGPELWKSDGTQAGTVRVKDICPGACGSSPYQLTNLNGTLYFGADDGTNGQELWKSDGSDAGTVSVGDIYPGPGSSSPDSLRAALGTLFFSAADPVAGREPWALCTPATCEDGNPCTDDACV